MTRTPITAAEAHRTGIVTLLTDTPFSTAMEIAEKMIQNLTPTALYLTKKILDSNAEGQSLSAAVHLENLSQVFCLKSNEGQEFLKGYSTKFQKKNSRL